MSGAWWIFGVGTAGVLGWVVTTGKMPEPGVYPMTAASAREKLDGASNTFVMYKTAKTTIRSESVFGGRVRVTVYPEGQSSQSCSVSFAEAEQSTRVTPHCETDTGSEYATGSTLEQYRAAAVMEHVDSVLRDREFDVSKVKMKQAAVTAKNLGAMQKQALEAQDQFEAMDKQHTTAR